MRNVAILLAAGRGTRMREQVEDKILALLAGIPVFNYSLRAFLAAGVIDGIVVVYRDAAQLSALQACCSVEDNHSVPVEWVQGGAERRDSVYHGLSGLPDSVQHVFIHDCARPLIQSEWIRMLAAEVARSGAVSLAHPVTDTIKQSANFERTAPGGIASGPWTDLDRAKLWAMETPQVFKLPLILHAYENARQKGLPITDDTAAITERGHPLQLLQTPGPNMKLTEPSDFIIAEAIIKAGIRTPSN